MTIITQHKSLNRFELKGIQINKNLQFFKLPRFTSEKNCEFGHNSKSVTSSSNERIVIICKCQIEEAEFALNLSSHRYNTYRYLHTNLQICISSIFIHTAIGTSPIRKYLTRVCICKKLSSKNSHSRDSFL